MEAGVPIKVDFPSLRLQLPKIVSAKSVFVSAFDNRSVSLYCGTLNSVGNFHHTSELELASATQGNLGCEMVRFGGIFSTTTE